FSRDLKGILTYTADTQMIARPSYIPLIQRTVFRPELNKRIEQWRKMSERYQTKGGYDPRQRARFVPMIGIQRDAYLRFIGESPDVENVDSEQPSNDVVHVAKRL